MKFAITGGIGSGKSTVCKIFNELGIDTFDSDYYAKQLYFLPDIKEKVIDIIGTDSILTNNEIDPKKLSSFCFNDDIIRNKIVETISDGIFKKYYEFHNNSKSPYTLFESAIILNTDRYKRFDKLIGVVSDDELRIDRVMKRSNHTREEVIKRMNTQISNNEIVQKCQFVIQNRWGLNRLKSQVNDIHSIIIGNIKNGRYGYK